MPPTLCLQHLREPPTTLPSLGNLDRAVDLGLQAVQPSTSTGTSREFRFDVDSRCSPSRTALAIRAWTSTDTQGVAARQPSSRCASPRAGRTTSSKPAGAGALAHFVRTWRPPSPSAAWRRRSRSPAGRQADQVETFIISQAGKGMNRRILGSLPIAGSRLVTQITKQAYAGYVAGSKVRRFRRQYARAITAPFGCGRSPDHGRQGAARSALALAHDKEPSSAWRSASSGIRRVEAVAAAGRCGSSVPSAAPASRAASRCSSRGHDSSGHSVVTEPPHPEECAVSGVARSAITEIAKLPSGSM